MVPGGYRQATKTFRKSWIFCYSTRVLRTLSLTTNQTSQLLQEYSGIKPEDQSEHVHAIREKAWAIRTYPSTGLGVWLIPYISLSPAYSTILQRLKAGETMIDVGCFVGGDFRRAVFDGAPSENMLGFDIADHWDVGYELFRDRETFRGMFVEADLMAVGSDASLAELKALQGRVGIILIAQVLHQWDWNGQVEAAKKLVYFSKPGTLVVGFQIGSAEAKEVQSPQFANVKAWRHDPASLQRMWDDVGEQTGTKWKVEAWVRDWAFVGLDEEDVKFMQPGDAPVDFVLERIE